MSQIKLAILGFNTDISKALFEAMENKSLPIEEIFPLSYKYEDYEATSILGRNYLIQHPDNFDYSEANILLVIGNTADAPKVIAKARKENALIIDISNNLSLQNNNSYIYIDGFNKRELEDAFLDKHIIPMGSVATMLSFILKPIIDNFGLNDAIINVMEAASGLGEDGTAELGRETIALLNMHDIQPRLFSSQMAFNIHTAIGEVMADGSTSHENEVLNQLSKVIGDKVDTISYTSMLVPVFYGHTTTLTVMVNQDISINDFIQVLEDTGVIEVIDDEEVTPAKFGVNEDKIIVSRIRQDKHNPKKFTLIAVMDNARRGQALNCLGVLENFALR
ncbi:MAG: Asd/ArgC dimerization domain-containing protein [Succinivibrionaceae bacterium]